LKEPNVFVVDDVAFIDPHHGFAIGREIEKRKIRKRFYLETRADILLRNKDVFRYWKNLGLACMFVGMEAIDEEALKSFRKGVSLSRSFEALEYARTLGVVVATNIIADTRWDEEHFRKVREWALSVVRMLFKFNRVFNAERLFADHQKPVNYEMRLPGAPTGVRTLSFFQVPRDKDAPDAGSYC
jgi:hypothetical protein